MAVLLLLIPGMAALRRPPRATFDDVPPDRTGSGAAEAASTGPDGDSDPVVSEAEGSGGGLSTSDGDADRTGEADGGSARPDPNTFG